MTPGLILLEYQTRIHELNASLGQIRMGQLLALAITCIVIALLFLLAYLAFVHRSIPVLWCVALPIPVAIYGTRRYRIRAGELNRTFRLRQFYERGVARLEGQWAGGGCSGELYATDGHPYEGGLNIFGTGSLFELLCTCRTEIGRRRLAEYLLSAPSIEEIRGRQEAVKELSRRMDLQEGVTLLGKFDAQQAHWASFGDWIDAPQPKIPVALAPLALLTSTSLGMLLLFWLNHTIAWTAAGIPIGLLLLAHLSIGLFYRRRLLAFFDRLRPLGPELEVLKSGWKLLQDEQFESVKLRRLTETLRHHDAAGTIEKLAKLVEILSQRDKEYFYAISRVLLIGLQTALRVEKWQKKYGDSLKSWLSAWGEFEAVMALGVYTREHPQNAFPELLSSEVAWNSQSIAARALFRSERCRAEWRNAILRNQRIEYGGQEHVTEDRGSQCGTYLFRRTRQPGELATFGLSICASLAVVDSLLQGKSKFLAEVDRLRQSIGATTNGDSVLFLFDEILSGTNSRDRRAAAEAIVRFLVEHGALGMLSTHDLALTEIASPDCSGRNFHMGSRDGSDPLDFDYLLKPGVTTETNAIEIARLAGVPV